MRRLALVGGIEGGAVSGAAAAYELRIEARIEAVLSAVISALIYEYCVVVVASNWLRAATLFVAAAVRL